MCIPRAHHPLSISSKFPLTSKEGDAELYHQTQKQDVWMPGCSGEVLCRRCKRLVVICAKSSWRVVSLKTKFENL